jgi:ABC-2 type transport system ATP-binding protein
MIVARHLTRRFGSRVAVDDLTFEVRPGEIFALLGPNGAGKTTTLRLLAGLLAPSGGWVAIDGSRLERATAGRLRGRIGFLTETPGLWERLTVRDNLVTFARLYEVAHPEAAVARLLREFGLSDRQHDPAAVLSKGMKQKLALARALVHDPAVLLLDEPTAALDPHTAREVRDRILERRRLGCAIVLSTHNLDEAERLADRIAVLDTRLLALDTPAALRERLFGRRVRVRLADADAAAFLPAASAAGATALRAEGTTLSFAVDDPDARTPAIVRALVLAGAAVRAVEDERPPLEAVYLRLLGDRPGR